ncbi:MAG: hypothetical protein ACOVSW_05590 [Candidatus Kapaibacteriota bacterium]
MNFADKLFRSGFSLLMQCVAVLAVVAIVSCQGPAGPQGPTGPQGPQGQQGATGAPGTAAASAQTTTITVAIADWRGFGGGTPGAYLQSGWKSAANITQSIMTSGVVLVFLRVDETNRPVTWQQLPVIRYGSNFIQVVDAQYQQGQVQMFINNSNTVVPPTPTDAITFRVVAIPGTTTVALAAQMDISNYEAVKAAFHLAD